MLLGTLAVIAVLLTITMFATKNSMLGFPSAMFWAILGAHCFTLSTIPWGDTYYYMGFASLLGMVTFCSLGAYGLRERRDTIADAEMEEEGEEEEHFIDEKPTEPSKRVKAIRERAEKRKKRRQSSEDW